MWKHTIGSADELDVKRRENLSVATSKTLFGTVFDLSDRARLCTRLLFPVWITGNGLVAPGKNKSGKVDSRERTRSYVVDLLYHFNH